VKDGGNWYAYCEDNPITLIDATGNKAAGALHRKMLSSALRGRMHNAVVNDIANKYPGLYKNVTLKYIEANGKTRWRFADLIAWDGQIYDVKSYNMFLTKKGELSHTTAQNIVDGQISEYADGICEIEDLKPKKFEPAYEPRYSGEFATTLDGRVYAVQYMPLEGYPPIVVYDYEYMGRAPLLEGVTVEGVLFNIQVVITSVGLGIVIVIGFAAGVLS
jgi:hypothetical protein